MRRAALTLIRHHATFVAADLTALDACDYTHTDQYTANADGTLDDPCDPYKLASGSGYAIGIGLGSLRESTY
jgi:hypothetical protein